MKPFSDSCSSANTHKDTPNSKYSPLGVAGRVLSATAIAAGALTMQGCGGGDVNVTVAQVPTDDYNQIDKVSGAPIAKEMLESNMSYNPQMRFPVELQWNGTLPNLPGTQKYVFDIPDSTTPTGVSEATMNPDGTITAKITLAQLLQTSNHWERVVNLNLRTPDGGGRTYPVPVKINSMPQMNTFWHQGTTTPCVINDKGELTQFEAQHISAYDPSEPDGKFDHLTLQAASHFEISDTGVNWSSSLAYNTGAQYKRVIFRLLEGAPGIILGSTTYLGSINDGKQNGYLMSSPRFTAWGIDQFGETKCQFEY